jgi:pyruvate dehydrogenase E2 component (dihydrolipoamide acetyltransferase)
MAEFLMPSLGADMETGILVEWTVEPGDRVKRGDIIAVVETNKGVIEIDVFEDGVVDEILVQEGEEVAVGTVLAIIRSEAVTAAKEPPTVEAAIPKPSTGPVENQAPAGPEEKPPQVQPAEARPLILPTKKRLRASPLARKLAAERGIDLSTVPGTEPDGAINQADVERAAQAKKATEKAAKPAAPDFRVGMRKAIAAAMARSNRDIPHYYLEKRIDMHRALQWLEAENRRRSVKERLLPAVLLIKAMALALGDVPELNGYWIDDQHQLQKAIHIGFAISLRQGGLVTPAIHHADRKRLGELMATLDDLITRTRAGRLRSSEMTDATITLTHLGDLGVEKVFGVIYPPQVALVGLGKITEEPWAENGLLGVRPVLTATLAADHRATDGRQGAKFLEAFNLYLQEPDKL